MLACSFLQPDPKHFEAGDYNLYRYCHNDPVNKVDPTGEIWDTIADIGFLAYDTYKLVSEGGGQGGENWKALGFDAAGALIPVATGLGAGYRAAKAIERANEAAKAVKTAESNKKIEKAAQAIEDHLGGKGEIKLNKNGDPIITRDDKRVRIDAKNPHGDKPHFHIEKKTESGKWKDAGDEHRYYLEKKERD